MPTVNLNVDVDLEEVELSDLLDEISFRADGSGCTFDELYQALAFGDNEKALKLARIIAERFTGRLLP